MTTECTVAGLGSKCRGVLVKFLTARCIGEMVFLCGLYGRPTTGLRTRTAAFFNTLLHHYQRTTNSTSSKGLDCILGDRFDQSWVALHFPLADILSLPLHIAMVTFNTTL